ncbi:MAG: hypothetical protein MRJ68_17610 [Nitrospira sp.]|nr:hypothetical protein [Nitrospira sp.]
MDIFRRAVDIRSGEYGRTGLMFSCMFLLIAAYVVMKAVRDSLFLYKLGVAQLPLVYILVAVFSGTVAWLYAHFFRRMPISTQLHTTFLGGAAALLVFQLVLSGLVLSGEAPWLYYALYLWVSGYGLLTVAQSWLFANQVFTAREAKRLFGVIGAGAILGGTLGGLLTTSLAALVGTEGLLLVAAGGYAACSGLVAVLDRMTRASISSTPNAVASSFLDGADLQEKKPSFSGFAGYGSHLAVIAGLIALGEVVATLVDYQFKAIVREAYPSKDALTAFLGTFYAGLGVVSFLVQLLTTGFVVQTLGLSAVLLSLPVTLLAGSLAVAVSPGFTPVAFLKLSEGGFRYSINKAGLELLYVPLPLSVKTKAKAFIDSVTERTAGGIGGLILLLATTVFSLTISQLSVVAMVLLALWIPLAALSQQRYMRALREGLQSKGLDSWPSPLNLSEAGTVALLTNKLRECDEPGALAVLKLLEQTVVTPYVPALLDVVERRGPATRAVAVRLLAEGRDLRVLSAMEKAIEDPDLSIRVHAMRFVCAARGCPEPLIEGWLASREPRIAAGAVVCALKDDGDAVRAKGRQVLTTLAAMEGPYGVTHRREAAVALGWIEPSSSLEIGILIALVGDADTSVARAALRSVARLKPWNALPTIISALLRNGTVGEAGDALAQYGPSVIPELDRAYDDSSQPVELRRRLPKVIGAIGGSEAVTWLMRRLDEPDRVARYHLVKALNKLKARDASLLFDPQLIERHLLLEIREQHRLQTMQHYPFPSDPTPGSRLFKQAVEERKADNLKLLFRLLGLLFPIKDIHDAYYGVTSDDRRVRDHAVEFMDSLLPETMKPTFIPLIDRRSSTARSEATATVSSASQGTLLEMLASIVNGPDPWLATCALYVIGEQKLPVPEAIIRDAMAQPDRMVREAAESTWRRLNESDAYVSPMERLC